MTIKHVAKKQPYSNITEFFHKFLDFLKLHNQENDFTSLASGLMENKTDTDNNAWQSALDRERFASCGTTCNVKYDTGYMLNSSACFTCCLVHQHLMY